MPMKLFAGCGLVVALAACAAAADEKDILDTAVGEKGFTIFVTAVREAELEGLLRGKGPFTVFAPTDAAFVKYGDDKVQALVKDKALLKKLVLAHVVPGKVLSKDDLAGRGGAKATRPNLRATNGVIHGIDTVLLPQE